MRRESRTLEELIEIYGSIEAVIDRYANTGIFIYNEKIGRWAEIGSPRYLLR